MRSPGNQEITPFLLSEVLPQNSSSDITMRSHWLRGGFPRAFLSKTDALAFEWHHSFIRTFLERDIPQLGFNLSSQTFYRFWKMLSHVHNQVLNKSKLGDSMGMSHTSIGKYIDIMVNTYMIRRDS